MRFDHTATLLPGGRVLVVGGGGGLNGFLASAELYDPATGNLSYDADGTGAVAAIRFAILTPGLTMTNADFVVI